MSILDPKFRYHNAEESKKPGYLANRFKQIQRELEAAKKLPNVTPLKRKVKQ